jgi:hypothetical protein
MTQVEFKNRISALLDDADPNEDVTLTSLVRVLSKVLTHLEKLGGRDRLGPEGSVEWWEDSDYVYFNDALPSDPPREIDICINGQAVFIRMAKTRP